MTSLTRTVWHAVPWLWLGLSVVWAVVIMVTEQLAWPLALWIATTLGPLTALKARRETRSEANAPTG